MHPIFSQILSISRREFGRIWNDSRLRSVVLIAPFVYSGLFCFVYSPHSLTELPIGVLAKDRSAPVRTFVRMLDASPKLAVKEQAFSEQELRDAIYSQKIVAGIIIPADFTRQLKRGHESHLGAFVNAASMVTANTVAKAITEVTGTFSAGVEVKALMKKGERLNSAREHFQPVKLDLHSLFNPSFNYTNFLVPGLLIAILQQVILLGVALSWTGEKEFGTLGELFSISKSPVALLVGKSLPYIVFNFVVGEFFLRVLFPLNDIPMEGSWVVAIPFTLLFIVTIVTWGMWVSGLCRTRLFATQILMFIALPSFILSGFTWPHEGMPFLIRVLAYCLPMTHFANSFRKLYLAGAPFQFVYTDFLMLIIFTAVNLVICYLVIARLVGEKQIETKELV
ncbi:MAG: ABC transporter permease [Deltaproteobacteria bacterium]|nr:ABC transporter permease [Deltaproteobacteria bacterium]